MIKLKSLIENFDGYEFVGFHRQRRKRGTAYDDLFITENNYGKDYFREILDSIYNQDRIEALNNGWLDFDWFNTYSDNYDKMEEMVVEWLNKKGYRWIFVTENRPHGVAAYGEYIYKIYFNKKDILHIFDDPLGADDIAYAYVYHKNNPPKFEDYKEII